MASTQFNFTKPPKLFFGFTGEQARELALLTEALIATTGMRPRRRPGQSLEMALIMEGLAARAVAMERQGSVGVPALPAEHVAGQQVNRSDALEGVGTQTPKRGRGRPRKGAISQMPKNAAPAANPVKAEPSYYLRLPAVKHLTGLQRTSIYDQMDAGTFPQNVKIGPRSVAWVRSEVIEWCRDRERASREGV
jgi:prophage regulatory protein